MNPNGQKFIVIAFVVLVITSLALVSKRSNVRTEYVESQDSFTFYSPNPLPIGGIRVPKEIETVTSIDVESLESPEESFAPPLPAVAANLGINAVPKISQVTPNKGGVDTEIVITGSGFLPTGNTVVATMEEFPDVPSSDGTTLRVTIKGPPFLKDIGEQVLGFYKTIKAETEYQVVVRNKNGASSFIPFTFQWYE